MNSGNDPTQGRLFGGAAVHWLCTMSANKESWMRTMSAEWKQPACLAKQHRPLSKMLFKKTLVLEAEL